MRGSRARELLRRHLAVERQKDPPRERELGEASQLLAAINRIGHQDFGRLGRGRRGHHLGLADLGDGQAHGAALELEPRHFHGLMGLGMRAQAQIVLSAVARHPVEIALQDVQVDGQRRRRKFSIMHGNLQASRSAVRPHYRW